MKKFLIAGSSLAAVAAAGSVGAVDVTLGGSIDMGVEYGIGKNKSSLAVGDAYSNVSLSFAAAGTTDAGMKFGGSFTFATAGEIELTAYDTNGAEDGGNKALVKMTVAGGTDLEAAVYNVSGGQMIDAANVVGVKINSSWMSVGSTQTGYGMTVDAVAAGNVCKVAGIAADRAGHPNDLIFKQTAAGVRTAAGVQVNNGDYLPAGIVGGAFYLTALGLAGSGTIDGESPATSTVANVYVHGDHGIWNMVGKDDDGNAVAATVAADTIFAGPFMEVKLQSSSTKMVVGAACVEGVDASETNYFLNNASKIVTASDASVYIEGGFGKLTLQTGDYAGGVSAIGDAGDEADLEVNGLGVIIGGVGMLGASPFIALDLAPNSAPNSLEILTGGTISMGGMSAAIDVAVTSADVVDIQSWDLGLNYAMGDMAVAVAYDSGNDWGMTASMDVAGFGVDATVYNNNADDHEKSGLFYSIAASTSLNGFGLSLGVDQDMQPTVNLSKSMGGLSIYAGYDAADEGGKIGATLSF